VYGMGSSLGVRSRIGSVGSFPAVRRPLRCELLSRSPRPAIADYSGGGMEVLDYLDPVSS